LVIRLLPVEEYAYYTIANTMLGAMTILADGGISTGVTALGGRVWKDRDSLGKIVATGISLRRKFALVSLAVAIPILIYLLKKNGASSIMSGLIALSLIPVFFANLTKSILEIPPKLHQRVGPLQRIQVSTSLLRLLFTAFTLFIFPLSAMAILCTGLPQLIANRKTKDLSQNYTARNSQPDNHNQKEILKIVRRVLPGSIYYVFAGQITIWVISVFGNTTSIADVGALGRLSQILVLYSSFAGILLIPRFARAPSIRSVLIEQHSIIIGSAVIFCSGIIVFFTIFPEIFLLLLGAQYSSLDTALALSITGGSINLITGIMHSTNISRGWIIRPLISIPSTLIIQILIISSSELSTTIGVLKMSILLGFTPLIFEIINYASNIYSCKKEPTTQPKP
tara:strand:- start:8237 stop:9424 length:1188 start_codon:yes stop_codon:yes gene_type:complete